MIESEYAWAKGLFADSVSQEGSSKGFEAMNQDTADELNGRFTAGIDLLTRLLDEATTERIAVSEIRDALLRGSSINPTSGLGYGLLGQSGFDATELMNYLKQMQSTLANMEELSANGLLDLQDISDTQRRLYNSHREMANETETMRKAIENKL